MKFFWEIPSAADADLISPVLPVWSLAQKNPVIGSRPNVSDLLGVSEVISQLYAMGFDECCPIDHSVLEEVSSTDRAIQNIVEKIKDDEIYHCFISQNEYKDIFPVGNFPVRSYSEKNGIEDYNELLEWQELVKFKKNKIKSLENLIEKYKSAQLLIVGKKGFSFLISLKFQNQVYECIKCDYKKNKIEKRALQLSPYSSIGACKSCNGHGMNLIYDEEVIFKESYFTVQDDGIYLLKYKRFSHLKIELIKELKKLKLDSKTVDELLENEKAYDLIWNGGGKFPGLFSCLDYLERKKYKRPVRIYLRGLQTEEVCESCNGSRISEENKYIRLKNDNLMLGDIYCATIEELLNQIKKINLNKVPKNFEKKVQTIKKTLEKSVLLGLGHISLIRKVKSLSTGEYQKILLVKFISYEGSDSLFIFDEPSLGLNKKLQMELINEVKNLRDQGNTIVIVEHSEHFKRESDFFVEMGPGAGHLGGQIIYKGKFKENSDENLIKALQVKSKKSLSFKNVESRYTSSKTFKIPIGSILGVYGPPGSGKTSIFTKEVPKIIEREEVKNSELIEEVIVFDWAIKKDSSRSTVGTMTGLSPFLRKYYAGLNVSKMLNLKDGHFSPNSDLGRCPTCEGKGVVNVDMSFMEDVQLSCPDCDGMKLRPHIANITDGTMTVHQALNKPIQEVLMHMKKTPKLIRLKEYFDLLNLNHLSLDRSIGSLSGGEYQRLKLMAKLQKNIENSLLIFEHLSFGLSTNEIPNIVQTLHRLLAKNNTIVLIDENEHILECCQSTLLFQ